MTSYLPASYRHLSDTGRHCLAWLSAVLTLALGSLYQNLSNCRPIFLTSCVQKELPVRNIVPSYLPASSLSRYTLSSLAPTSSDSSSRISRRSSRFSNMSRSLQTHTNHINKSSSSTVLSKIGYRAGC
jgi:hypothetical protein